MSERALVAILVGILHVGKKLGNFKARPDIPSTVREAQEILASVDASLSAPAEEVDAMTLAEAVPEGDDIDLEDIL